MCPLRLEKMISNLPKKEQPGSGEAGHKLNQAVLGKRQKTNKVATELLGPVLPAH